MKNGKIPLWILLVFSLNFCVFCWFLITDVYPIALVGINASSIIGIVFMILRGQSIRKFLRNHLVDVGIVFTLFILAFAIRIYKIDVITPGMWGDEVGYAKIGERLVDAKKFVPFSDDLFAPPTPFLYLIGFTVKTLGRSMVTVRLWGVIFGALGVSALYILLCSIFTRRFALMGSALILVLYHHMIISRFAYEMTAGVFFEILTLLFLYESWKTKRAEHLLASALTIAGALYTYLAFRTHAIVIFVIVVLIIWKIKQSTKDKLTNLAIFCIVLFIALVPWFSFSIRHPDHVMARAKAISVFHQNLPASEVMKEIWGSTKLSLGMFLVTGDPNPRQNPSMQTSMYDLSVVGMSIVGCIYLFKKNKPIALALLILMIPSFVNDIFSIELIPEFHYYGTGHPSATRTLGLIPLMMVLCTFGYYAIDRALELFCGFPGKTRVFILGSIVGISMYFNWVWYFQQPPSKYLYNANMVRMIDAANFANLAAKNGEKTIALSKSLLNDQRVDYFIDRSLNILPLDINETETSVDVIPRLTYTLIDVRTAKSLAKELIDPKFAEMNSLTVRAIKTQWPEVDTLIVYKQ